MLLLLSSNGQDNFQGQKLIGKFGKYFSVEENGGNKLCLIADRNPPLFRNVLRAQSHP